MFTDGNSDLRLPTDSDHRSFVLLGFTCLMQRAACMALGTPQGKSQAKPLVSGILSKKSDIQRGNGVSVSKILDPKEQCCSIGARDKHL